jgi:hypothetical protein
VLLVIASSLAVSTAALLDIHDHGQGTRTCNICIVSHVAWQQASSLTLVLRPTMREWRQAAEEPALLLGPSEKDSPSRAPPA